MKNYKYQVNFQSGGPETVYCSSFNQALILATAKRINDGLNTFCTTIFDEKDRVREINSSLESLIKP